MASRAPIVERQLPTVSRRSKRCAVIVRQRGTDEVGLALIEALRRAGETLLTAYADARMELGVQGR